MAFRTPVFALLLACAAMAAGPAPEPGGGRAEFVQAVEFPYYLYPADLWQRELVWLKGIGVQTVVFSIPWNWHQLQPGDFDFTGRTSPRRDLTGFLRLLRKLKMRAWVRPLPPVAGWLNSGWPTGTPPGSGAAQRAWLEQLERLLGTQTVSHGGPIAFVEGRGPAGALAIDAGPAPAPAVALPAGDPASLFRSREALAGGRGALLWTGVEDSIYPEGWAAGAAMLVRPGAVSLAGEERVSINPLRRNTALLRNWGALIPALRPAAMPKTPGGLPEGVRAIEVTSPAASAVSITNSGKKPFAGDLRVLWPPTRRTLVIPGVSVPPGQSLWLPLNVSLGPDSLCRECSNFSPAEHIVYATAELLSVEFENGILAMEFAAPEKGEVILQLAGAPVGPFLAGGKPTEFDWDDKALRARLAIPASSAPGNRVRIGIAIEEPETSAFFNETRRLLIGRTNLVSTVYSSADVASRSRLRLPDGFTARQVVKSPNEIDYEVAVPADALHGDWADFVLEADGMPLGRARLQLFRPATIRLSQAMRLHIGQVELTPAPPAAAIDPKGGIQLEVLVRNNSLEIQTYHVEPGGGGLEFFPPKADISVGALEERAVPFRVFAADGGANLRDWHVHVTGGTEADMPMRALVLPRGRTVAWSADLDGDGSPEWVLESRKARAVFSAQDGGRWMEFCWKDSNLNFLPEQGVFAAAGAVEVKIAGEDLEFAGRGWRRTVRLNDAALTVEQTTPLPPDQLAPEKHGNTGLEIERTSPGRAVYTLR